MSAVDDHRNVHDKTPPCWLMGVFIIRKTGTSYQSGGWWTERQQAMPGEEGEADGFAEVCMSL